MKPGDISVLALSLRHVFVFLASYFWPQTSDPGTQRTRARSRHSRSLNSYGLNSYGLNSYGLNIYGRKLRIQGLSEPTLDPPQP